MIGPFPFDKTSTAHFVICITLEGAFDDGQAFKEYCKWLPDRPRGPDDPPTLTLGDLFKLDDVGRPTPQGHPTDRSYQR